jgi:phospholipase C
MSTDRRSFLQLLTTGALSGAFPASIARALEIPANHHTGSIADVEHIVIMMQENRSFDHYFGTLRGVRGFGDPRPMRLASGKSVWHQPNGADDLLPFHPGAPNLGLQFIEDLAHDWTTTHQAWNEGKYDQWVASKGTTTMAHLTRSDIPFHYALADAFTICDAYHCSLLGPTDPNRYYMWTGWVGNDGQGGGPVIDNAEAGYDWSTYPERLQAAGVSWKIYQDQGEGLTADGFWGWTSDNAYIGNYGDNSLLYFHQYQNAAPGSPLADGAKSGTNIAVKGTLFDIFRKDVQDNKLPQVSWIAAPEAYTEHPNWPANYGAWYVSQILDALTANPEVWSKTAFFLMYDENDGFFDHMVPPTPPPSAQGISTIDTTNEFFAGNSENPAGPYGLGVRVPLIVISPWSKGGWVSSEVFDHTSLIQFIEKRFGQDYPGLREHNITKWRRAVTGDLTSAFDFRKSSDAALSLPSTIAYLPPDNQRHPDYKPAPPTEQSLPTQEPGTRPARAVPYELNVRGEINLVHGAVTIHFHNTGDAAAVFQVRSNNSQQGPWSYTVGPRTTISDQWKFNAYGQNDYDLSVYGPNGLLRTFKGSTADGRKVNLEITSHYDVDRPGITLEIQNRGQGHARVQIRDTYTEDTRHAALQAGGNRAEYWPLESSFGWYDFVIEVESEPDFQQRIAGHVETGKHSMTDPAIGK